MRRMRVLILSLVIGLLIACSDEPYDKVRSLMSQNKLNDALVICEKELKNKDVCLNSICLAAMNEKIQYAIEHETMPISEGELADAIYYGQGARRLPDADAYIDLQLGIAYMNGARYLASHELDNPVMFIGPLSDLRDLHDQNYYRKAINNRQFMMREYLLFAFDSFTKVLRGRSSPHEIGEDANRIRRMSLHYLMLIRSALREP